MCACCAFRMAALVRSKTWSDVSGVHSSWCEVLDIKVGMGALLLLCLCSAAVMVRVMARCRVQLISAYKHGSYYHYYYYYYYYYHHITTTTLR